MIGIPRPALVLGLAGLIPFVWGVLIAIWPQLGFWLVDTGGSFFVRFAVPNLQFTYGSIILAFMSGVLWGFTTKATGAVATVGYVFSVIPALWSYFLVSGGPAVSGANLTFGFLGLLILDLFFWQQRLAPRWWMRLRLLLTFVVVSCLLITDFYA